MAVDMTYSEQLAYAEHVLKNNVFSESEVTRYRGEGRADKLPHGIALEIWQQAAANTGFELGKLDSSSDGKYWIPVN